MFVFLMRIMIPVYIFITVISHTPLLGLISEFSRPAMAWLGLPGEAVVVILLGNIINLYGAIGAISGLELTGREITILGGMLTISHSLPMETTIIKKSGVPVALLLAIRMGLSFVLGVVLNVIL